MRPSSIVRLTRQFCTSYTRLSSQPTPGNRQLSNESNQQNNRERQGEGGTHGSEGIVAVAATAAVTAALAYYGTNNK